MNETNQLNCCPDWNCGHWNARGERVQPRLMAAPKGPQCPICGTVYSVTGTEEPVIFAEDPEIAALQEQIRALLDLDQKGALTPHGIGGHARTLLSRADAALTALDREIREGIRL